MKNKSMTFIHDEWGNKPLSFSPMAIKMPRYRLKKIQAMRAKLMGLILTKKQGGHHE